MIKRLYLFAVMLIGLSSASYIAIAQDETDAFRYSYLSTQGTARSIGFGGALGSIGGDFSSLSVNPAGIGVYRSSEFTFAPAIRIGSVEGRYTGNSMADNNTRFTIGNLGLVLTSAPSGRRYQRADWKSVSFGIGINRVADFNRNYVYSGRDTSSFTELFAYDANKYPEDINNLGTYAGLGYQSYLLDTFNSRYISVVPWWKNPRHQRAVRERGGMTDFVLSVGGNYRERLILGATLGIPSLRYTREMIYQETDESGESDNFFNNFKYTENLTTEGTGINLKLGFIYKLEDQFRLGFAFHTPTYFGMKDVQTKSLTSNTENFKTDLGIVDANPLTIITSDDIPTNTYEYSMITPWRTVVSGAAILGKTGFVTMDYEFVDYSSTRFRYAFQDRDAETYINEKIRNTYKGGHIIRLGGEAKFDMLMLRLGIGYYTSPFKNYSGDRLDASAGVGLRFDTWFLDLGFVNTRYERREQPFDLTDATNGAVVVPTATLTNNLSNVAITIGFKF